MKTMTIATICGAILGIALTISPTANATSGISAANWRPIGYPDNTRVIVSSNAVTYSANSFPLGNAKIAADIGTYGTGGGTYNLAVKVAGNGNPLTCTYYALNIATGSYFASVPVSTTAVGILTLTLSLTISVAGTYAFTSQCVLPPPSDRTASAPYGLSSQLFGAYGF